MKEAKRAGYYIDFLFVTAGTPEKCYERVQERVKLGGHDVPRDKLFSRFERTMSYLKEYLEIADHADVWDNSSDHLVLMLSKEDGKINLTVEGSNTEWVKKYLPHLF